MNLESGDVPHYLLTEGQQRMWCYCRQSILPKRPKQRKKKKIAIAFAVLFGQRRRVTRQQQNLVAVKLAVNRPATFTQASNRHWQKQE